MSIVPRNDEHASTLRTKDRAEKNVVGVAATWITAERENVARSKPCRAIGPPEKPAEIVGVSIFDRGAVECVTLETANAILAIDRSCERARVIVPVTIIVVERDDRIRRRDEMRRKVFLPRPYVFDRVDFGSRSVGLLACRVSNLGGDQKKHAFDVDLIAYTFERRANMLDARFPSREASDDQTIVPF